MANPFPGMDPYLEGTLWPSVHAELVSDVCRRIAAELPPGYTAREGRWTALVIGDDETMPRPDVELFGGLPAPTWDGTAPLYRRYVEQPIVQIPCVEIRNDTGETVTVVEARHHRTEHYRRLRLVADYANYVEIDLLRCGGRWRVDGPLPPDPYFVYVRRAGMRSHVHVWPVPLASPLPVIPIPLGEGTPDIAFDLQSAFGAVYERGQFDGMIDYADPPPWELTADEAAFIDERLRAAGKRP